eukprot:scaffold34921_cov162-Amphora_coffeaeformis.AAC.9
MSERLLLLSDLEESQLAQERQESAAEHVLERVGELLRQADDQLEYLEDHQVLGSAIYRTSQDLASAVGNLAHHLEHQNEEEQRALAGACLRDVQEHCLYLQQQQEAGGEEGALVGMDDSVHDEVAQMKEHDFVKIIQAAGIFLRDIEASLRAIELEEAEELADVALTVARLFIASLQSMHSQLVPEDLLQFQQQQQSTNKATSLTIEEIIEEEDNANATSRSTCRSGTGSEHKQSNKKKQRRDRLRVLWPPLGPQVSKACQWGQSAALEQPLLAVALAFTLWPAAVVAAFCTPPLLIADKLMQDVYNHFQGGSLLQNVERGAAQLYHTGRLALVSGKLVTRQGLRIARRQVDRNGGLPQIAQNILAFGVDRVTHPVETVGMVWDGLCWTKDRVCETIDHFQDEERHPTVVQLQQ